MKKNVSNLLSKISKARDVINSKNFNLIYNRLALFQSIDKDLKLQIEKYLREPSHELDITPQDLKELSNEIYSYICNKQNMFTFDKLQKELLSIAPVTGEAFKEFSLRVGKSIEIDTVLRACYKTFAYVGIVIFLWSDSTEKKPFELQLIDTLRDLAR